MARHYYIVEIEGIPAGAASASVARYCYPDTGLGYANATYTPALAEPPTGASAQWSIMSGRVSSGRFKITLRPYQDDNAAGWVNLQIARAGAATQLTDTVNSTTTTIPLDSASSVHGIQTNDHVWVERETMLVTGVTDGATPSITVTRGVADSTAAVHTAGADVFTTGPPALTGRRVRVYTATSDTATSNDETLILSGYISGEIASGMHWPAFACVGEFGQARLNSDPAPEGVAVFAPWAVAAGTPSVRFPSNVTPRFHADGGYWVIPKVKNVVIGAYDGAAGTWSADPLPVYGSTMIDPEIDDPGTGSTDLQGYQIAWASIDQAYPPFKDETGTESDHAIDVALCVLLTKTGAADYSNFDLGSDFSFDCALGAAAADVDIEGAKRLRDQAPYLSAQSYWLGGETSETLHGTLDRLLSPVGISTGVNLAGKWLFLKLRDFYPDETAVALDGSNLINPATWKSYVRGRSLDRILIEADAVPKSVDVEPAVQTVNETGGRNYYSRQLGRIVGDTQRYKDCPYPSRFLVEDGAIWTLIAARVRRLSDRVQFYDLEAAGILDTVDLGDFVTVLSPALRSPITGARLTASDDPLKCIVTSLQPDYVRRTTRLTVAFLDTGKTCLVSPSATVTAWAGSPNYTATCNASDFTASDDVGAFAEGDECVLLNSDLTLKSDDGTNYVATVDSINSGASKISFDDDFRDSSGVAVTPIDGDVIAFAIYNTATTSQKDYGYLAADGARPADPNVGAGVAPYVYGDT